jgi:hypothetical protein
MRLAAGALLQAADAVESNKTQSASPVKVSDQVSLIMDRKQYNNHKTQTTRKKAKGALHKTKRKGF